MKYSMRVQQYSMRIRMMKILDEYFIADGSEYSMTVVMTVGFMISN